MTLTMQQLSNEYENSILIQQKVIDSYRTKLGEARSKMNFKEIKRINTLLRILYEEKNELQERAHGLKKYCS